MSTPKHLKVQTLLAFLLLVGGSLWAYDSYEPKWGVSAIDMLFAIVGAVWLLAVVFTIWWKKP